MTTRKCKISARTVEAAKPEAEKYRLWDIDLPGFGLWVYPNGGRSYFFKYRAPDGAARQPTIGKHGALTPVQAREIAKDWAEAVRKGGDPLAKKRKARDALTVADLLDAYLASAAFAEKAESTQATDRGRIDNHLKPRLGRKVAEKLSRDDVRRAKREIGEGKTAREAVQTGWRGVSIVRGGEGVARQAVRLLSAAFSWAIVEKLIDIRADENPALGVAGGDDGERDIVMRNADDYERLFQTLDKMERERRIRPPVADAIRVIALTGARRSEITGLEWSEVDLERGVITKPAKRHKTGRKIGKPRIIGLPALAQAIIARQPAGDVEGLVFPPLRVDAFGRAYVRSRKGRPGRIELNAPWRAVRAEAKLSEGIGLHGLRHSLATHMALSGAQASDIMTALGHRKMSTAQRYIHYAEDARAALAERAAGMITAAATGRPAAEIVEIEKARGK